MATLILTAVGSAVAGPIGGAVGSIIGQGIDARLFAPKARQGPRLGELAVQTSSYGTQLPKIFGRMRVAGTVIWATDLQERRDSSGGGKGRPKTIEYSYSASFAVALSGRRAGAVRRIWADGKLLRGAGGDWKSRTSYRFYPGDEEQPVDPLIAAAEGIGQAPAFRGIAYALFEDFELADYGNRIPSLSFEIEAEAGAVSIGAIAEELSAGAVIAGATPPVAGYAASGDSVRGAIEALGAAGPLSLIEDAGRLRLTAATGAAATIAKAEAGARGAGDAGGAGEVLRGAAGSVPGEVSVAYYDEARDYQTGLQRATRDGSHGARGERLALAAVLAPAAAKAIAERRLAALWAGRSTARLHLPPARHGLRPGARLRIAGEAGIWKVERWTLHGGVVSLELARVATGSATVAPSASAGRATAEADVPHGPTMVRLLDLPLAGERLAERPTLLVAAAGASAGWRRAALSVSWDGGASWQAAGATAPAAVMGRAVTALGPGAALLIDARASVDVELLGDAMWLESRDDDALAGGANLALIGDELVQFASAQALGGRRFRLSRLLRGRRGTEWATAMHLADEGFVLIAAESLVALEPPAGLIGGEARLLAEGIGDADTPAAASLTVRGEAVRPPSPAHLTAERLANGDVRLSWVRRSRAGWAWVSGSDTPLGEEREAYRVTLTGAGVERVVTVAAPGYVYTAAAQAADGMTGAIAAAVAQLGTFAASRETGAVVA